MAKKVILSWSGGKDCSYALDRLRRDPGIELSGLLTTVNADNGRISMHGVHGDLLLRQVESVGLPLRIIALPPQAANETYEEAMTGACASMAEDGIEAVAFADLFLRDIRAYRERQMAGTGLEPLFPLWDEPTADLARSFIISGFRATVVCVDPKQLDPSFSGRDFDEAFLRDLPPGVDPCGENGEFHTFVHDGPVFSTPVDFRRGDVLEINGFYYCDLIPA
jgi:uncharacterized protein (TIGR00290 family)